MLDRIERGDADWGWALPPVYFDPARRLAAKYGVNRSQFFVQTGVDLLRLRIQYVASFVPKQSEAAAGRELRDRPLGVTPHRRWAALEPAHRPVPASGDARLQGRADLSARWSRPPPGAALARGNTRSGKVLLYTIDAPHHLAFAQTIKQNLAKIGLEVTIKAFPLQAYFGRLMARAPYDLGFATWVPDYADPYAVLNVQLDGRFIGATNWARFDSPTVQRLLRRAARLKGADRYSAYGELDVRLARDAAPMVAVDYLNDPVLVSKRVGCVGAGRSSSPRSASSSATAPAPRPRRARRRRRCLQGRCGTRSSARPRSSRDRCGRWCRRRSSRPRLRPRRRRRRSARRRRE